MKSANRPTWDNFYLTCDPLQVQRKNELCRFDQVKIIKVKPRAKPVSEDVNLGSRLLLK